MKYIILLITFITFFYSCKKEDKMPPIDNAIDLDGTQINDSSLTYPERFLLSAAKPNPSNIDLNTPVIIAAHGFTASTFEWIELRDFAKSTGQFYTSIVLLGGHGRDYSDFKAASWQDWQQPIIDEYVRLRNLGYTNISFIGSSTGCPLVLNAVYDSKINPDVLKNIFLIDPIIVPSNKILSIVNTVGPALSYSTSEMEAGENGFWYKYRPYQALSQLNDLTQLVRKNLEDGIVLPSNVKMYVYKSKDDGSADPVSAPILYSGVKQSDGSKFSVQMVNSNLHVFSRLKGRPTVFTEDLQLQQTTFNEIKSKL